MCPIPASRGLLPGKTNWNTATRILREGRRLARYRGRDKGEIVCTQLARYCFRARPESIVRPATTKRFESVVKDRSFLRMQIPVRALRALLTSRTTLLFGTNSLFGLSRCRSRFVGFPLLSLSLDRHPLTIDCMLPLMDRIGVREGFAVRRSGPFARSHKTLRAQALQHDTVPNEGDRKDAGDGNGTGNRREDVGRHMIEFPRWLWRLPRPVPNRRWRRSRFWPG